MSWYYLLGGLILYAVDHLFRLKRSVGHKVNLITLQPSGGDCNTGEIVHLSYTVTKQKSIFNG